MKQKTFIASRPYTLYLCAAYFLFLLFTACNDSNETNTEWKQNNQKAYEEIETDKEWLPVTAATGGPTGVYYKVLPNEGVEKGTEHPIQTAAVTVNYTGRYYTETIFISDLGAILNVNVVVRGLGAALQNMVVGDKWNVCIPYHLGYGTTVYGSIPAYTTLFFEIELLKINQYPK
jgi:FKBP-type peptidyl-prolyl cis-trans isomerase